MVKKFCEARKEFSSEGINTMDKLTLISEARELLKKQRRKKTERKLERKLERKALISESIS